MNAPAGSMASVGTTTAPIRIVVIGGGFTGLAFIIHAIRTRLGIGRNRGDSDEESGSESGPLLQFDLIERNGELGRGIAYGTPDRLHRINVPSDRMSLLADDPRHATRWLLEHDTLDPGSTDANGHHYVAREHYGAYVAATLSETLTLAGERVRFTRWPANATAIRSHAAAKATTSGNTGGHGEEHTETNSFDVVLDSGHVLEGDRVVLCIGHAPPALPCAVSEEALGDPALIVNPWAPRVFEGVPREASVLIVGTGLTMADCAVSLLARDHRGPITAISRRGLLAQPHGLFSDGADFLRDGSPPDTARALVRLLRKRIAHDTPQTGWQPTVDAFRFDLPRLWGALPPQEKRRVIRRLLAFWDVHRFRVAPQVHAALRDAIDTARISIERLGIAGIERSRDGLVATLRRPTGELDQRVFDRIVFCTGPSRNITGNPLVRSLLDAGLARLDATGVGLDVTLQSQIKSEDGRPVPGLFALGPITRGTFGEMTGAPDIARHIEKWLKQATPHLLAQVA